MLAIDEPQTASGAASSGEDPANSKRRKSADGKVPKKQRRHAEIADGENEKDKAYKELFEAATKSVAAVKSTYDRIHRDLSAVNLIEEKLKKKTWNTTPMVEYREIEETTLQHVYVFEFVFHYNYSLRVPE